MTAISVHHIKASKYGSRISKIGDANFTNISVIPKGSEFLLYLFTSGHTSISNYVHNSALFNKQKCRKQLESRVSGGGGLGLNCKVDQVLLD